MASRRRPVSLLLKYFFTHASDSACYCIVSFNKSVDPLPLVSSPERERERAEQEKNREKENCEKICNINFICRSG